ncbi:RES family NAD+ phosphorylase [Dyadobacter luticola]|uniref:RES domain-containing protein n=1 Tax=Dyadobacter luticola TaxID=1979387 RepID=A0A5R9KS13_9BACT|nr:RES family NAD+ phosphorylase [Dyadobacter luticola]TLU98908.1 RES domain-containing protein [Dyadobacter luticola]
MRLYRITSPAYANDLSGTGCMYTSGRWHFKGTRVLYTSEHISLSKLEILANSPIIPKNQVLVTIDIPDTATITHVLAAQLPANWWEFPYSTSLATISEAWIQEGKYWIMRVPSAQSFAEYNYLLNPLHPEHASARIVKVEPVHFDKRLK